MIAPQPSNAETPQWENFRRLLWHYRKHDPVLQLVPPADYASEIWLAWSATLKMPFNPTKRKSQLGYMVFTAKRILRETALKNYQPIGQSKYYYKKDGNVKKKTESYDDFSYVRK
ncbi:MAG: hypothetical protein FWB90_00590 [Fibromonadales bacterium]|nr:hypothetical protein [Fibromonadales bacterium]